MGEDFGLLVLLFLLAIYVLDYLTYYPEPIYKPGIRFAFGLNTILSLNLCLISLELNLYYTELHLESIVIRVITIIIYLFYLLKVACYI
jgi:hypothetical protein